MIKKEKQQKLFLDGIENGKEELYVKLSKLNTTVMNGSNIISRMNADIIDTQQQLQQGKDISLAVAVIQLLITVLLILNHFIDA